MMMSRDSGWIQTIAENGQEAVDLTIHAFRVAEDPRVYMPFQVNMDGFILSHMIEPIYMPDKSEVDAYLPSLKPGLRLDPQKPVTFGPVGMPDVYTEAKVAQDAAFRNSKAVILEAWKEFGDKFGRYYKPVETYKAEDAETIIVTMGSLSETAMSAVDHLRDAGQKVGLARIRLWRPFPTEEFFDVVKGAKNLVVLDRAMNFAGNTGPVCTEIKSILFDRGHSANVFNFMAGLGGRDVTVQNFEEMVQKAATSKAPAAYEIINVRE